MESEYCHLESSTVKFSAHLKVSGSHPQFDSFANVVMSQKTLKDFFQSSAEPGNHGAGGGQNVGSGSHQVVPTQNTFEGQPFQDSDDESIGVPMPINPQAIVMPHFARTPSPKTMMRYVKAGQHFPHQGVFKKMYDKLQLQHPDPDGVNCYRNYFVAPVAQLPQGHEALPGPAATIPKPNPVYFTPERKPRFPASPHGPRKIIPKPSPMSSPSDSSDLFSAGTLGGSGEKAARSAGSYLMCDANRATINERFFHTPPTTPDAGAGPAMMSPEMNQAKKRVCSPVAADQMPASSSSSSSRARPEIKSEMSLDFSFNVSVSESSKRRRL